MRDRLTLYRETGRKAVEYQLQYLQPDGGYIWDGYANDAFHKQAYSWAIAGHVPEAHRLLTWVFHNRLREDGELKSYNGDFYKYSWFFQGAHRLGRFDLSYPVISNNIAAQTMCGGLPLFAGDTYCRSLATCWTGVSAIYAGNLEVARRAAEWAISVYQQQPEQGKFYFQTSRCGQLVTPDMHPEGALHIDCSRPKQDYWEVGLPMQLMCRLYMVTRKQRYLDYARKFFEFKLSCYEDAFTFVGSGKSSLAAALYYLITGDEQARDCAMKFADFLVDTQYPEGGWRDPDEPDQLLIYIDHAAEFNIWLHELSSAIESRL